MPDNNQPVTTLYPVPGMRLGTACAGIKKPDHRDLVVMELAAGSQVAAVFTRNAFCAAPVTVARQHLSQTSPRFLLVNTGNANAGTGEQGITDALTCCDAVAQCAGCTREAVLPFSTGVIGEALPVDKICQGIPGAYASLSETGWEDASHGILTTDTVPKAVSRRIDINGRPVTITGMAKGSGMIRPDMATMLAYIATDAQLESGDLQACLYQAVESSFNRITVDGDTSTNDACLLIATGQSGVPVNQSNADDYRIFCGAVKAVCEELALAVVRDGEGATKLMTILVEGGVSEEECLQVAYTVAHSPLVKTAFFASDPNWGRILAAVGRAGISGLDLNAIQIFLEDVCIVSQGGRDASYREEKGQSVMDGNEITVRIVLGRGDASARVWTCDLSYDYVRINAEYRT
ncbi:bifunctional glutamate N-acetyltransferase/amino-acid acetyltransferase ArgJ [Kaarinaea lacus]